MATYRDSSFSSHVYFSRAAQAFAEAVEQLDAEQRRADLLAGAHWQLEAYRLMLPDARHDSTRAALRASIDRLELAVARLGGALL